MDIQIIGTIDSGIVAMLGPKRETFHGMERLVIVNLKRQRTSTSKPLASVMAHVNGGGITFDDPVADEDRAAAIELARKQFEIEGYGSGGEKALSG
jgi:hypothetical protein